ncbi:fused (3R)-hydroxyacyl-ACP dehydratase subunits HadA/HadB [Williamsia sp. MIQD14]|uniref:fused (3R)-hydroxyacyl-ACP dehydratase subunits HadA/HadB n=1 Tax=Williamsia sp. MIQD14 TaxID=3425703 RepID=UPI003D9FF285
MKPEDVSSEDRDWTQYYRPDDHYQIGREEIREFARSMKDGHIVHWHEKAAAERGHSGLVAPLTFTARLAGSGLNWLLDNVLLEYDTSAFVQTDQVFTYHRPMHAGDRLSLTMGLTPIRQKAGGDTIIVEGLLINDSGELVASLLTTAAGRRGAHAEPALAAALSDVMMGDFSPPTTTGWHEIDGVPTPAIGTWDHDLDAAVPRFSDVSVGDVLPSRTVTLRRGDLVNYAGISADWNPIHWSERAAGIVGLDTCAAHGMLTMGIGSSFVTGWVGDPTAVRDYRVRFTGIAYVAEDAPAEVEYTGRVKSLDEQARTATIALGATFRGKRIFGRATATVALR